MKYKQLLLIFGLGLCLSSKFVLSSHGDRSEHYVTCQKQCFTKNCTAEALEEFYTKRPLHHQFLGWDCGSECSYMCMWKTVEFFKSNYDGFVPQFYGKWPFVRLFGLQEPASVLFSVSNALPHLLMLLKFRQSVSSDAPLYWDTHFYCLVCLNAWWWSAVFHARDTPLTEKLDYFCALSLVMYSVFHLARRCLLHKPNHIIVTLGCMLLVLFLAHISYLGLVKMDYGWNMKVNILFAAINLLGWCIWSVYHMVWYKRHYCWSMLTMSILLAVVFSLELLDFPPLWWMIDAHALWHAGTSPLSCLLYRFFISDCLWLYQEKQKRKGDALPYHGDKND